MTLSASGALSLDGRSIPPQGLAAAVEEALRDRRGADRRAILAVHASHPFQRVADVLDVVKGLHPDVPVALTEARD